MIFEDLKAINDRIIGNFPRPGNDLVHVMGIICNFLVHILAECYTA
jgi:hypothetical protein